MGRIADSFTHTQAAQNLIEQNSVIFDNFPNFMVTPLNEKCSLVDLSRGIAVAAILSSASAGQIVSCSLLPDFMIMVEALDINQSGNFIQEFWRPETAGCHSSCASCFRQNDPTGCVNCSPGRYYDGVYCTETCNTEFGSINLLGQCQICPPQDSGMFRKCFDEKICNTGTVSGPGCPCNLPFEQVGVGFVANFCSVPQCQPSCNYCWNSECL